MAKKFKVGQVVKWRNPDCDEPTCGCNLKGIIIGIWDIPDPNDEMEPDDYMVRLSPMDEKDQSGSIVVYASQCEETEIE